MATMNNTKIGGRISEIDIILFLLEKFNEIAPDMKFRMGIDNDNLVWYKPNSPFSRIISEELVYDKDTYLTRIETFTPCDIQIAEMGLTSALDHLSGSAVAVATFVVNIEDFEKSELSRISLEKIRDVLRQGFYVKNIYQRPYDEVSPITTKPFKFNTNTGTLVYEDNIDHVNGKQYVMFSLNIDIEFTDMEYIGNEYMIEMAIKTGENTYSEYERMYPINVDMGMTYSTKEKQELLRDIEKTLGSSNESAYLNSEFRVALEDNVYAQELDASSYPIGTVIKQTITKTWQNSTVGSFEFFVRDVSINSTTALTNYLNESLEHGAGHYAVGAKARGDNGTPINVWQSSVSGGPYEETVLNASITSTSALITYLNSNYPASGYSVGDKIRGSADGETYYYAIVQETYTYYYSIVASISPVTTYFIVNSTESAFEEQKSWEAHSIPESKSFSISMDFVYRKPYAFETVGILRRLYEDTVKKQWGYNVYKIKITHYDLGTDGNWTLDEVVFERYFILTSNEVVLELGTSIAFPCIFVVSDIK